MEESGIINDRYIYNKKKIKFNRIVKVCLVPYYNELCENFLDLWWSCMDAKIAKNNAVEEIYNLINNHPSMEIKQAVKLLYQPNNISYDPSNFEV